MKNITSVLSSLYDLIADAGLSILNPQFHKFRPVDCAK